MSDLSIGDVVNLPPLAVDSHRPPTAPIVEIVGDLAIMAYTYTSGGVDCSCTLTYPLANLTKAT